MLQCAESSACFGAICILYSVFVTLSL